MPSPIVIFEGVFDFMRDKALSRSGKQKESYLLAEGICNGAVVASHKVMPSRRPRQLLLWADNEGQPLRADGSDLVTLVAAVADGNGVVKRLNNYFIRFEVVEGDAEVLGDASIEANPAPVRWGTAAVLLRAGVRPGKIKVRASVLWDGKHMPAPAVLELESVAAGHTLLYDDKEEKAGTDKMEVRSRREAVKRVSPEKLKEVEHQQSAFE